MPEEVEALVLEEAQLDAVAEKLAEQYLEKQRLLIQWDKGLQRAVDQLKTFQTERDKLQGALGQLKDTAEEFGIDLQEWISKQREKNETKKNNS